MDVSNKFLIVGCIVLVTLILIYFIVVALLYWRQNPTISVQDAVFNDLNEILISSTVTDTYIGTRGDMGNQMFQLACIIAAAERSKAQVVLPTRIAMLPIIDLFDLTHLEWKDVNPDAIFYEYDNYENIIIPNDGRVYNINGYRQAYRYFEDYAQEIRALFTPKPNILNAVRAVVPNEQNYIAVHIRRGDYVKLIHKVPILREFRQCQLEYYKEGIRKLRENYPECPLLVCTDSPQWVIPLLAELDSKAILAPVIKDISPKFSDFCVLYLAKCGVVMSNSSYSWWASYLNPGRSIICPSPWWDNNGFIGKGVGLDGPYLHYQDWWLLDADTGQLVREPHSTTGERPDRNKETLNLYRLVRGTLL